MRPDKEQVMLGIAMVLSMRAQCAKRQVGCVLTDRQGRIIGTGYNGRPRLMENCDGANLCSGGCEGVHAEVNALLQADPDKIETCYVTHAPCWHCVKALINTSCSRIVFKDDSTTEERSMELWLKADGDWIYMPTGGVQ